ncbi:hypothetical protein A3A68_02530 [Candidatus Saccharibacteria bacterium RIFCSPLOWO2_01_FULL_48_13]|nr:MAG: hypothetical protein A2884_00690 [Candidatus Saccharibacteria bacterium RIFCSPHIGHO2_01_FULL_48_12]OGL35407.1 MAG: hypothetical protein A3F38_00025 [Candidatus Saccharibacteria bacterium RIFCSPHIGHO2_12_FULL_48_21]OGL37136.1 MAG: hypothetical protein A3A68_02530 [Candidatus Saccharibacteria bacterium RIFCSPLOWO2_01_FULL_48_13]
MWAIRNFSPTARWYIKNGSGGDYDYPAFFSWPPLLGPLRRDERKILVCSTRVQHNRVIREATAVAVELGIDQPTLVYCKNIGTFWPNFFGCRYFVTNWRKRRLPALIVATGQLRHYDPRGTGMTLAVDERLKEIASNYGIPIELRPEN